METGICCRCHKEKDLREFKVKTNGKRATGCMECNDTAKIYAERSKCPHGRQKSLCRECGGVSICPHERERSKCKFCNDPIEVTIKRWILHCRQTDKKCNRFDPDHFIDTDFLHGLIEDYECCYYDDCKIKLQYTEFKPDVGTIERLNNSIGHVKSNCVLCCKNCNVKKKSNRTAEQQVES